MCSGGGGYSEFLRTFEQRHSADQSLSWWHGIHSLRENAPPTEIPSEVEVK